MIKKLFIGFALLLSIALLYAMNMRRPAPDGTTDALPVVVTFYPLAEFTTQVGGNLVSVRNLTPVGTEPHDFDPTPQDIVAIQNAKLFVYNGAGFETWLNKSLGDIQKETSVLEAVTGLQLQKAVGENELDDPHVWLDPVLASKQVENIKNALSAVDPTHAEDYAENAREYQKQLEMLDADFRAGLSTCESTDIVTSHNAFAYLADRYDLKVQAISGLSPDEEPSPKKLAEVVQFTQANAVKYILFETLVSPKLAQTIASETGAGVLVFNPLEGLTEEQAAAGGNYISVQRENLATLRTALGCK